ncbi:hypothetical protein HYFRA_00013829 [Hymenoscyphus fraxineus]|uniref:Uncharacterized protein n=1 Tax=Hymenoscyphus fraxineus TaxID=746836 RepID=A0A9N9LB63_9HELO|nr:hypothetical protein HYFRA_00013829 [Hymenoscyphus fraxineus]
MYRGKIFMSKRSSHRPRELKDFNILVDITYSLLRLFFVLASRTARIQLQASSKFRGGYLLSSSFATSGVDASYIYSMSMKYFNPLNSNLIGEGIAGITIASRLAENCNLTVVIIEAGGLFK